MPRRYLSQSGVQLYNAGVAIAASVATIAALKALEAADPSHVAGNVMLVDADGSEWVYHPTSALTGDDILVVAPTNAAGRWLRKVGRTTLYLPFTFATADGATLLTVPAGCTLKLDSAHWKVTTPFAGGAASAIGIDSSIDTTPGDILGGAAGDVEATLVAGAAIAGTIGAKMDSDTELHAQILPPATTIRLQRITSAFTSGVGAVGLVVDILANAGA